MTTALQPGDEARVLAEPRYSYGECCHLSEGDVVTIINAPDRDGDYFVTGPNDNCYIGTKYLIPTAAPTFKHGDRVRATADAGVGDPALVNGAFGTVIEAGCGFGGTMLKVRQDDGANLSAYQGRFELAPPVAVGTRVVVLAASFVSASDIGREGTVTRNDNDDIFQGVPHPYRVDFGDGDYLMASAVAPMPYKVGDKVRLRYNDYAGEWTETGIVGEVVEVGVWGTETYVKVHTEAMAGDEMHSQTLGYSLAELEPVIEDEPAEPEPENPLDPSAMARAAALLLATQVIGTDTLTEDLISAAAFIADGTQALDCALLDDDEDDDTYVLTDKGRRFADATSKVEAGKREHEITDRDGDSFLVVERYDGGVYFDPDDGSTVVVDGPALDDLIAFLDALRTKQTREV